MAQTILTNLPLPVGMPTAVQQGMPPGMPNEAIDAHAVHEQREHDLAHILASQPTWMADFWRTSLEVSTESVVRALCTLRSIPFTSLTTPIM